MKILWFCLQPIDRLYSKAKVLNSWRRQVVPPGGQKVQLFYLYTRQTKILGSHIASMEVQYIVAVWVKTKKYSLGLSTQTVYTEGQHDSSPKVKPKCLNCPLVAVCNVVHKPCPIHVSRAQPKSQSTHQILFFKDGFCHFWITLMCVNVFIFLMRKPVIGWAHVWAGPCNTTALSSNQHNM